MMRIVFLCTRDFAREKKKEKLIDSSLCLPKNDKNRVAIWDLLRDFECNGRIFEKERA